MQELFRWYLLGVDGVDGLRQLYIGSVFHSTVDGVHELPGEHVLSGWGGRVHGMRFRIYVVCRRERMFVLELFCGYILHRHGLFELQRWYIFSF